MDDIFLFLAQLHVRMDPNHKHDLWFGNDVPLRVTEDQEAGAGAGLASERQTQPRSARFDPKHIFDV